jgi:hypothetical protein
MPLNIEMNPRMKIKIGTSIYVYLIPKSRGGGRGMRMPPAKVQICIEAPPEVRIAREEMEPVIPENFDNGTFPFTVKGRA